MDVFTLSLWALRIGFVLLIYAFFVVVARALWRDLRAGVAGAGRPLARLLVVGSPEGRPQAGTSIALEQNLARWSAETLRQRDTREEFSSRYGAHIATIPWSPTPPTDLDGLGRLLDDASLPWEAVGIDAA